MTEFSSAVVRFKTDVVDGAEDSSTKVNGVLETSTVEV
jgi:hypothetical protein